jgi:hypothetical protein
MRLMLQDSFRPLVSEQHLSDFVPQLGIAARLRQPDGTLRPVFLECALEERFDLPPPVA